MRGFPWPEEAGVSGAGGCSAGMENPLCAYMHAPCLSFLSLWVSRTVLLVLSLSLSLSMSLPVDLGLSVSLSSPLPFLPTLFLPLPPLPYPLSLAPSSPPFSLLPVFLFSPSVSASLPLSLRDCRGL